jgi:hypothetical protein
MKKILCIFLFLQSCYTNNSLVGTYSSNKSPHRFTFNPDSTFYYQYKGHIWRKYSTGYWERLDKHRLKIQSIYPNTFLRLKVDELTNLSDDKMSVSINIDIPKYERKYYKHILIINDSLPVSMNCDSSSFVINKNVKNFVYKITADDRVPNRFLDTLTSTKYYLKQINTASINIDVSLVDSLFDYQVFNQTVIKIGKNKIMYNSRPLNKSSKNF